MDNQPGRLVDEVLGVALPQAVRAKTEKDQLAAALEALLGELRAGMTKFTEQAAHIAVNTRQAASEQRRGTAAQERTATALEKLSVFAERETNK